MNAEEGKLKMVKLVECPRDAMQGWPDFIPTEKKIDYLEALIGVGFDSLDFGSFVSPKAIPQMADTKQVIASIQPVNFRTRLLAIVANTRGATDAASYPHIRDIGFPFLCFGDISATEYKFFDLRFGNNGFGNIESLQGP